MEKIYSVVRHGGLPPDIPDARAAKHVNKMCDPRKLKAGERPALPMPVGASLNLCAACASANHELHV